MEARYEYEVKTVRVVARQPPTEPKLLNDPEPAAEFAEYVFERLDADQEHFVMVAVDGKNHVIGYRVMSSGTETQTLIDPRTLFRTAMVMDARGVIVAHNHPSGGAEPSADDCELTRRLVKAGETIGIAVHDHVILAEKGRWVSLRRSRPALFSVLPGASL